MKTTIYGRTYSDITNIETTVKEMSAEKKTRLELVNTFRNMTQRDGIKLVGGYSRRRKHELLRAFADIFKCALSGDKPVEFKITDIDKWVEFSNAVGQEAQIQDDTTPATPEGRFIARMKQDYGLSVKVRRHSNIDGHKCYEIQPNNSRTRIRAIADVISSFQMHHRVDSGSVWLFLD